MTTSAFHDAPRRLAQDGSSGPAQLVRITALDEGNRYQARPIEFDSDGSTKFAGDETLVVTNLAEPYDEDGAIASGTDALAVDVEGRWVVFIRPTAGAATFLARIVSAEGAALYTIREQAFDEEGGLVDKQGAPDLYARNLAEASLGGGTAVDVDAVVIVTAVPDSAAPPAVHYFFDHPVYARYLE
ncbi:MAG: hypothetical protein ACE15C_20670 [Phycisphaerae bacterium]